MCFQNTFRKYIIDAFYAKKSIFTPSGTVFSKFIALELFSETLRNKLCHDDVIHVTVTSQYLYGLGLARTLSCANLVAIA